LRAGYDDGEVRPGTGLDVVADTDIFVFLASGNLVSSPQHSLYILLELVPY